MPQDSDLTTYKPSAFYFRRALRNTDDPVKLRALGISAVLELEQLKAWVREQGMIPPKWNVPVDEAREKGWGQNV